MNKAANRQRLKNETLNKILNIYSEKFQVSTFQCDGNNSEQRESATREVINNYREELIKINKS